MISEKITKQKKETEQIIKILEKLWPLMQKIVLMDSRQGADQQTKNVLISLGQILGKDTAILEAEINKPQNTLSNSMLLSSSNEISILKKENDFLKFEITKQKTETHKTKKLL